LKILWNIGHIRLYIRTSLHVSSAVGKPWRVREKVWCAMATNNRGDISEVKFLTVAEVASVMRVSKMTVYRLVHSGELPAVRVGRSFRVSEDDVNDYLRSSFFNAG
jgi:excisionase family DNA binding protein